MCNYQGNKAGKDGSSRDKAARAHVLVWIPDEKYCGKSDELDVLKTDGDCRRFGHRCSVRAGKMLSLSVSCGAKKVETKAVKKKTRLTTDTLQCR
jgi:hypothetical protein